METETQSERLDELRRELKIRATAEVLRVVTERFRDRLTMSTSRARSEGGDPQRSPAGYG